MNTTTSRFLGALGGLFAACVILLLLLAQAAFAAPIEHAGAASSRVDPALLTGANILGVAAAIRAIIGLLKLPFLGELWVKVSPQGRVLLLLVLGGLAAGLEALGAGKPPLEAVVIALSGLGLAVGSREMVAAARKPRR